MFKPYCCESMISLIDVLDVMNENTLLTYLLNSNNRYKLTCYYPLDTTVGTL